MRIDLLRESAPDATTLLKFRRLLERHRLTERILACLNAQLAAKGLLLKAGGRDPQMHQTQKGNPWHFVRCAHAEAIFGTATAWRPASATGRLVA